MIPSPSDDSDPDDSDPDVTDPDVGAQHPRRGSAEPAVVAAVSAGGVLGAWARYGLGEALPHAAATFPWSTLVVNASGCLLIALVVGSLRRTDAPRLAQPFLATGVLGGYTTFSTFAVEAAGLLRAGRIAVAIGYVALTLAACAAAVWAGDVVVRRAVAGSAGPS